MNLKLWPFLKIIILSPTKLHKDRNHTRRIIINFSLCKIISTIDTISNYCILFMSCKIPRPSRWDITVIALSSSIKTESTHLEVSLSSLSEHHEQISPSPVNTFMDKKLSLKLNGSRNIKEDCGDPIPLWNL